MESSTVNSQNKAYYFQPLNYLAQSAEELKMEETPNEENSFKQGLKNLPDEFDAVMNKIAPLSKKINSIVTINTQLSNEAASELRSKEHNEFLERLRNNIKKSIKEDLISIDNYFLKIQSLSEQAKSLSGDFENQDISNIERKIQKDLSKLVREIKELEKLKENYVGESKLDSQDYIDETNILIKEKKAEYHDLIVSLKSLNEGPSYYIKFKSVFIAKQLEDLNSYNNHAKNKELNTLVAQARSLID